MEWEDKADTDKTWENCKKNFKGYYQSKKHFGSTQPTNQGFESAANLNEGQEEEMELMERNHNSEQINAMTNTTKSMVEMCAQIAVAKAEQEPQSAELNTKIDLLTKMVKNSQSQSPQKPQQRGGSEIVRSAKNSMKKECVGRTRIMTQIGRPNGSW